MVKVFQFFLCIMLIFLLILVFFWAADNMVQYAYKALPVVIQPGNFLADTVSSTFQDGKKILISSKTFYLATPWQYHNLLYANVTELCAEKLLEKISKIWTRLLCKQYQILHSLLYWFVLYCILTIYFNYLLFTVFYIFLFLFLSFKSLWVIALFILMLYTWL